MGYVRNWMYRLLAAEPWLAARRRRVAQGGVTVFMYHDIGADDENVDVWQIVRRSDFLRQIDYVRRHYDIVSLDDALAALHGPEEGRERPMAVFTFDDGHRGYVDHLLPVTQSEALPVTLYIATGHIESGQPYWFDRLINHLQSTRPIHLDLNRFGLGCHWINGTHGPQNWARIQAVLMAIKSLPVEQCDAVTDAIIEQIPQAGPAPMVPLQPQEVQVLAQAKGITIGAHTDGHEVLPKLSLDEARHSIARSVIKLQEWTGQTPRHFAYPAGYHNHALQNLVESMGFATAMTTDTGIWHRHESLFRIPRISIGRYDSLDTFKVNSVRV